MMKKLVLAAAGVIAASTTALADPIFGTWQTIADDNGNYGHILVRDCDDLGICGTLVRSFDDTGTEYVSENQNRAIIWDMQADGDGAYSGGKVWSPDRDKTYNSKLQLSGDTLTVKGCVFGICRDGGVWARVN